MSKENDDDRVAIGSWAFELPPKTLNRLIWIARMRRRLDTAKLPERKLAPALREYAQARLTWHENRIFAGLGLYVGTPIEPLIPSGIAHVRIMGAVRNLGFSSPWLAFMFTDDWNDPRWLQAQ